MNAAEDLFNDDEAPRSLRTRSGAWAEVHEDDGGNETLRLCAPDGAVLFEYDGSAGRGVLRVPAGDLRLEAPRGNIELLSGQAVRCLAAGSIDLQSATSASVSVQGGADKPRAGLRLGPSEAALAAERLHVGAKEAELELETARLRGRRLSAAIERADLLCERVESEVGTLVERAAEVYRQVSGLHQLRAGRLRSLVEGALQMRAGHVKLEAEEEVFIDGEQIHLG